MIIQSCIHNRTQTATDLGGIHILACLTYHVTFSLGFKITMDGLSSQVTKIISIAESLSHINSTLLTTNFPEEGIYEFEHQYRLFSTTFLRKKKSNEIRY